MQLGRVWVEIDPFGCVIVVWRVLVYFLILFFLLLNFYLASSQSLDKINLFLGQFVIPETKIFSLFSRFKSETESHTRSDLTSHLPERWLVRDLFPVVWILAPGEEIVNLILCLDWPRNFLAIQIVANVGQMIIPTSRLSLELHVYFLEHFPHQA